MSQIKKLLRSIFRPLNSIHKGLFRRGLLPIGRTAGKKKKYSIVAPIYNVEKYLDDFFISIVRQKHFCRDIEVIAVIDGVTDGSLERVEKWRQRFPSNIYIVEQENCGAAAARNAGLPHASGEWVTFIDPDDFISFGYFNEVDKLIDSPIGASLSLVSCNLIFYNESTGKIGNHHTLDLNAARVRQPQSSLSAHILK